MTAPQIRPIAAIALLALSISLSACLKLEDAGPIGFESIVSGTVDDPVPGPERWFAVGALSGTDGSKANGVAQAHYLEDGTFIVGVRLNIEPAPEGSAYVAWIEGRKGRIKMGSLTRTDRGKHDGRFLTKADLRGNGVKIVVTLANKGESEEAGSVVAEGVLKHYER